MTDLKARPFAAADIPTFLEWFPDAASVMQWAGPRLRAPLDCHQLAGLLDRSASQQGNWQAWTVHDAERATVGHFQLRFDAACRQAMLGRVAIAPGHRGRGLADSLARVALAEAFAKEIVHRVEFRVFDFNAAAIATYLKVGFVTEGICRETVPVGGAFWNTVIMNMLRREWTAVAPEAELDRSYNL